ncbi:DUF485 domain-containing protein [Burkholderia sp. Ac-20379]|nr:DUF485 domain-containing protein [Burkholderia sp. Ac-20379]MBN3724472.1 DUF485 domain-containing protein [Burkholderia sp. Ac-20379]
METVASPAAAPRSPAFLRLVSRRRTIVTWLTASTLVPYYLFVLVAACKPAALATRIHGGSAITVGWIAGGLLIVGAWLLTGLYVRYANGEFERLSRQLDTGVAS